MTLGEVFRDVRARFEKAGLPEAAADARALIAGLLDISPTALVTDPQRLLGVADQERLESAALRRLAREPVFRILGYREFYGLEFKLSEGTLEPRPDTEILVDRVLPYLQRIVELQGQASLIDFGTGTGAIALALLANCEKARATGVDISLDALATAAENADRLGLASRFATLKSDWLNAVTGEFDIVVSNPPYIVRDVVKTLSPEVRLHDPVAALDGGEDGLSAYRVLAASVGRCLRNGGVIGLEIGYDQRDSVANLFEAEGYELIEAARDLGGQDRVLIFTRRAAESGSVAN